MGGADEPEATGSSATVHLGPPPPKLERARPDTPRRGETVGRFVVLDTLGIGGMGVVVSAYAPKLDRKVALKLLRPDVAPAEGATTARVRLLREAKAMAKLRHPNVVTVFEVGEFEGQVFLAMEHVGGGTMVQWSAAAREEAGGWERIVAAFVQAGRGLVAAHAEGLVHRDFKPGNILVEGDRFQVTDFGIASIGGNEVLSDLGLEVAPPEAVDETATLPQSGQLIGTAPYMAPELLANEPAAAKSDQFAFCVSLFEALFGQRPFAGRSNAEAVESIRQGRVEIPEDRRGVPPWVLDAILRGLDSDPDRRWPTMAALVEALDSPDDAEIGRRTRLGLAIAIGVSFVALPFVARSLGPPFDRSTYAGVLGQTLSLLAILVTMAWFARGYVRATVINRKVFAAVVVVLFMQVPLELTNAALGVPVVASDIQHLVLWGAMASMFAITVDRRFLVLAASYLACLPLATRWTGDHVVVLGLSNAMFVVFVAWIWRGTGDKGLRPIAAIRSRMSESVASSTKLIDDSPRKPTEVLDPRS